MEPRDFLFFDRMITPKVITFLYWLLLVVIVLGGIVAMFTQSFLGGLVGMVIGAFFARIWCELLIVLFKMNDALQAIRNSQTTPSTAGEA
jgi:hypothetical protein